MCLHVTSCKRLAWSENGLFLLQDLDLKPSKKIRRTIIHSCLAYIPGERVKYQLLLNLLLQIYFWQFVFWTLMSAICRLGSRFIRPSAHLSLSGSSFTPPPLPGSRCIRHQPTLTSGGSSFTLPPSLASGGSSFTPGCPRASFPCVHFDFMSLYTF